MSGQPMNITLPTDGQADWGEGALNDVLQTIIDEVERSVTQADVLIGGDLDFNNAGAVDLGYLKFRVGGSEGSGALRVFWRSGELFVADGSGNEIQFTLNGSLNVSTSGGITGLAGSGATAAYSAGKFTWQKPDATGADMEFGSLLLRESAGAGSDVGTIQMPAMAGSKTYTWVSGTIAAGEGLVTMDSAGAMGVTKDPSVNTLAASGISTFSGQLRSVTNAVLSGSTFVSGSLVNVVGPTVLSGSTFVSGSLTLSGSLRHTTRPRNFDALLGVPTAGSAVAAGGLWQLGASSTVTVPLTFDERDRVIRVRISYARNSGATMTFTLNRNVNGTLQLQARKTDTTGSGVQSITLDSTSLTSGSLPSTMHATGSFSVAVDGDALDQIYNVSVDYDRI